MEENERQKVTMTNSEVISILKGYDKYIERFGITANMSFEDILALHNVVLDGLYKRGFDDKNRLDYMITFFGAVARKLLDEDRLVADLTGGAKRFLPYVLARVFMRHVYFIYNEDDWKMHQSAMWQSFRPVYIPGAPHRAYKGEYNSPDFVGKYEKFLDGANSSSQLAVC